MQSPFGASRISALEILAIPLVLLRFPPWHPGAPSGFVLPELGLHATSQISARHLPVRLHEASGLERLIASAKHVCPLTIETGVLLHCGPQKISLITTRRPQCQF